MSSIYCQEDIISFFINIVTLISQKNFSAIPFEHVVGIRRMRILAGDVEILYGTEKGGVSFLIKILSFVPLVVNVLGGTHKTTDPMR